MDLPDQTNYRRPMDLVPDDVRGYKRVDKYSETGITRLGFALGIGLILALFFGGSVVSQIAGTLIGCMVLVAMFALPFAIVAAAIGAAGRRFEPKHSLPSRPVLRETEDPCIVEFGPEKKLAIGIASFFPSNPSRDRWLEDFPTHFGIPVLAIQTTGCPNPHDADQAPTPLIRFLLIDPSAPREKILAYLDQHDIKTISLNPEVFTSSAAHDWIYEHHYAQRITLGNPIQSIFVELQSLPNHTAIVCASGDPGFLLISCDFWLYRKGGLFAPTPMPTNCSRLKTAQGGKLKFAAALISMPLRTFTEFKRVEPRKLIRR